MIGRRLKVGIMGNRATIQFSWGAMVHGDFVVSFMLEIFGIE